MRVSLHPRVRLLVRVGLRSVIGFQVYGIWYGRVTSGVNVIVSIRVSVRNRVRYSCRHWSYIWGCGSVWGHELVLWVSVGVGVGVWVGIFV